MKPLTLYLVRGLPGSGKSTFAKQLVSSGLVDDHFEADMFFIHPKTGEYNFNRDQLPKAHMWCQSETKESLSAGRSVVVSNTFVQEWEIEAYIEMAKECNAKLVSTVVENRHEGKTLHDVPEQVIKRMENSFEVCLARI